MEGHRSPGKIGPTRQAGLSVPAAALAPLRRQLGLPRHLSQRRHSHLSIHRIDQYAALLTLDSARSEVQVANLGVTLAKQEVDQARDRFQAGVANNIEVISAQDSLSRANDNQIAAHYPFKQARSDCARAIGQMEKTYAK